MVLKFYNNKINESLKFKVDASGVDASVLEARLIFITDNSNQIIFGKVNENNQCVFNLPKLEGFKKGDTGKVQFELINDDSYFKVWENNFQIESKGEVKVEKQVGPGKITSNAIFATLEEEPIINQENVEEPIIEHDNIEDRVNQELLSKPEFVKESKKKVELPTKEKPLTPAEVKISKIAQSISGIYEKHYNPSNKAQTFKDFIKK